jgi:hypothetical protein
MLVRRKGEADWEVVGEDIAISFSHNLGFWNRINEWIGKRSDLYPVEDWLTWSLVVEKPEIWRRVFEAQQHQAAPPSTVKRSR